MTWPTSQDYNEAIQDPRTTLNDPELRGGEATTNALGLPRPRSGNFADVYELHCPDGGRYALKCFTREIHGLQQRYQAISENLRQAKLPFTVDFNYLEKGVRIHGVWYPLLKMQWVEGFTLNTFVRDHLDKPATLEGLIQIWLRMARRLREAYLAHGDLQHSNVLLVPGSTAKALAVKLIDYDGMFIPGLARSRSGEVGHPAYQHPQRLCEGTYNAEVDRFPTLVIVTALRCLVTGGRALWDRFDNGDNLLFREADLRDPDKSDLFGELRGLKDPAAVELVEHLAGAAYRPLDQVPLLEELLPEKKAAAPAPKSLVAQPKAEPEPAPDVGTTGPVSSEPRRSGRRSGLPVAAWLGGGVAVVAVFVYLFVVLPGGANNPDAGAGSPIAHNTFNDKTVTALTKDRNTNGTDQGNTKDKDKKTEKIAREPVGVLIVETNEANPDVYIDGELRTVAWDSFGKKAEINIKPGIHQVEIKKDGFKVYGQEVVLEDGRRRLLTARLDRKAKPAPVLTRTGVSGGFGRGLEGWSTFQEDRSKDEGLLIGFKVTTSQFLGPGPVIKSLRPIYLTPKGKTVGGVYGDVEGSEVTVEARDGYAVGGLVTKGALLVDGFKVVFMRIQGDVLDPKEPYESSWYGGQGGRDWVLGGDGKPVVGIHGARANLPIQPTGRVVQTLGCVGLIHSDRLAKPFKLVPVGIKELTPTRP